MYMHVSKVVYAKCMHLYICTTCNVAHNGGFTVVKR